MLESGPTLIRVVLTDEEFCNPGQLAQPLLLLLAQLNGRPGVTLARPPMMVRQGEGRGGDRCEEGRVLAKRVHRSCIS